MQQQERKHYLEYRVYKEEYRQQCMELILEFAYEASKVNGFVPEVSKIDVMIDTCKGSSLLLFDGMVLVGVIGGYISQNFMDNEEHFQEVLYYVKIEYRHKSKELFNTFELMLRNRGIRTLVFGCVHDDKHKLMDRFYRGLGFKPIEHHYKKRLI